MLQFTESGLVSAQMYEYFKNERLKSLQMMTTLLNHPAWKGTDEDLPNRSSGLLAPEKDSFIPLV